MTDRGDPGEQSRTRPAEGRAGTDPAGVGEFKAVAGRLLEAGSRRLGDAWAGGRRWLASRRTGMDPQHHQDRDGPTPPHRRRH